MANPIRNTPRLFGKDAERFLSEINKLPSSQEKAKERERIAESVCTLEKMIKALKKN